MPKRIKTADQRRQERARSLVAGDRSGSQDPFYRRKAWLKLRRWHLAQPGNQLCAECRRANVIEAAVVVDHIVPRQTCPERELDPTNLQSLCRGCDNRKRAKDVAAGLAGRGSAQKPRRAARVIDLTGSEGES